MRLTENFDLSEFVISQTAARKGIDNTPPADVVENLKKLARALEEVRKLLGNKPISVSSGYRCKALNKAVGGSKTSSHMQGYAVDFICPAFGTPKQICKALAAAKFEFDQIINEMPNSPNGGWVHLSVAPAGRKQVMTSLDGKTFTKGVA